MPFKLSQQLLLNDLENIFLHLQSECKRTGDTERLKQTKIIQSRVMFEKWISRQPWKSKPSADKRQVERTLFKVMSFLELFLS